MLNQINTFKLVLPWFILWGAISILFGYLWRKFVAERTIKSAEKRAKEIIKEAEDLALKKKREIDIEAKELLYRLRSDFERETKNKRKELQFQEKRLQQKELTIERKAEILEMKEEELSRKEKEIQRKEEELKNKELEYERLLEEEKRRLEMVSGMTREEAKNQLLKLMEEEAKKEGIKLQMKIEEEARENAERKAREILLTAMQRLAPEEATESVVSVVSLPSDDIKGRIIGREGRNIKVFEAIIPAIYAHSLLWIKRFCPKLVLYLSLPRSFTSSGCTFSIPNSNNVLFPSSTSCSSSSFFVLSTTSSILAG